MTQKLSLKFSEHVHILLHRATRSMQFMKAPLIFLSAKIEEDYRGFLVRVNIHKTSSLPPYGVARKNSNLAAI